MMQDIMDPKQRVAMAMMAGLARPQAGAMAGGMYAPSSPLQGLASLAAMYGLGHPGFGKGLAKRLGNKPHAPTVQPDLPLYAEGE